MRRLPTRSSQATLALERSSGSQASDFRTALSLAAGFLMPRGPLKNYFFFTAFDSSMNCSTSLNERYTDANRT